MKLNNFTRINQEDYPAEDQETIGTLAGSLNPFLQRIVEVMNGNLDFDNLNQQPITFEVELKSTGIPKAALELKSPLKTKPRGLQVVRVENMSLNGLFPSATPFITFGLKDNNLQVQHIAGLPADTKFRITAIIIG